MALSFPGMRIWDKFQKSQTSLVTWMIVAILLWGGEVRAANFYYDFLWSAEDNQYLIDDMLSQISFFTKTTTTFLQKLPVLIQILL